MSKYRLIAVQAKWRRNALPLTAIVDGANIITGQTFVPGIPEFEKGLTKEQLLGKEPLTEEQKQLYGFIIEPEAVYRFPHNMQLDDETPEGKALLGLLKLYPDKIAQSKDKLKKGTHSHYIEDKVDEAKKVVQSIDLFYDAVHKIKNASTDAVEDVAAYLTYMVPQLSINTSALSRDEMYAEIFNACKEHPNRVMEAFDPGNKETLTVIKLIRNKIITESTDGIRDGNNYLGRNINEVVSFLRKQENSAKREKLMRNLTDNSRGVKAVVVKEDNGFDTYIKEVDKAIEDKDLIQVMSGISLLENLQLTDTQMKAVEDRRVKLESIKDNIGKENEARNAAREEEYKTKTLTELYAICISAIPDEEDIFTSIKTKDPLIKYMIKNIK